MAELIARTPLAGLLPVTIGTVTMTEVVPDRLTLIAPFRGQQVAGFPTPGRTTDTMIWVGQGQALALGDAPDVGDVAAITDQTDAFATLRIAGAGVEDVLARLVPIDLRASAFAIGHTARTLLGHMIASVTRRGDDAFEVMVMRSMAQTLVHDLTRAAQGVALR
ncbi:sarcosine oxidase subunit gamma [Loktanella sp. DJP18]|uniref:sarcosine oxidase subunit gamma n=1 Tax=Loktanella sp. DJP18 TaxID=3409788 RepID=UPI003BB54417